MNYYLIRNVSLQYRIFKFQLRFWKSIDFEKNGNYNPLKYFDMQIIQKEGG